MNSLRNIGTTQIGRLGGGNTSTSRGDRTPPPGGWIRGRPMRTFACHSRSTAMAMDPTMRYLACVSRDAPNVLSMYDLRTGECIAVASPCKCMVD